VIWKIEARSQIINAAIGGFPFITMENRESVPLRNGEGVLFVYRKEEISVLSLNTGV
jgi:hypothetical protein